MSGIGTIAAARVISQGPRIQPLVAVSMYARRLKPYPSTRRTWRVGHPDGSAHRIISDTSAFIGHTNPATRRIIAAGDLNMVLGTEPADL